MKYRMKMILEDGRVVYATRRGKIDETTEEHMKMLAGAPLGYFSPDLSMFTPANIFPDYCTIAVKSRIWEKTTDPLDKNALLCGGEKSTPDTRS